MGAQGGKENLGLAVGKQKDDWNCFFSRIGRNGATGICHGVNEGWIQLAGPAAIFGVAKCVFGRLCNRAPKKQTPSTISSSGTAAAKAGGFLVADIEAWIPEVAFARAAHFLYG